MNFLIISGILLLLLFVITYFSKRRFGMLGLGLAAGSVLSEQWVGNITPLVEQAGLHLAAPPLESVVAAALILIPAMLLMFCGPVHYGVVQRLSSALLFTCLAVVFLLDPLQSALIIDGVGKDVYNLIAQNRILLISFCLLVAIADLMITRIPKPERKH